MTSVAGKTMLSERVSRLKERLLDTRPHLCTERLRFLREAYRETEGQPMVIRRARVFEKFLSGMTISIDENPIVGKQTKYVTGLVPHPEYSCRWMRQESTFYSQFGEAEISEEDRELLYDAAEYWGDKCVWQKAVNVWMEKHDAGVHINEYFADGVWNSASNQPKGRICVDYGKVLNRGLEGVVQEAREALKDLPLASSEALRRRDFLNAVVIACNAVITIARRYASLAGEMADGESDPRRKAELRRIALTCQHVPAKPARGFYEALQSFWFVHLVCHLELGSYGHAPGRFSQYMYPFYRADREVGKVTDEDALELLELLYLKFSEVARLLPRQSFETGMGTGFQNIAIGGVTPDGKDATNEIDYLLIEAQSRVRLVQPTLSLLYHDRLADDFLMKAMELVSTGIGMPAFFNSDINIQRLCAHGVSLEDARNHCIIGCVETGLSHTADSMHGGAANMPKVLELVLHNGRDPVTGKQFGIQTGEVGTFRSYDDLWQALRKQLEHLMALSREFEYLTHAMHAEYTPAPFHSALVDDCLRNGRDMGSGGSRYRMNGGGPVGMIDLADSLAAIKKLVFDDRQVTMQELVRALDTDFEGCEALRGMLLQAPKYGNDDEYVDSIARELFDLFYAEHQKYNDHLGAKTKPYAFSVSIHNLFGAHTGALPSGRKARQPLADGSVSASPGRDVNGPTALIQSASRVMDTSRYASSLLNMKFHPRALQSREGRRKLLSLIKSYIDLGGHHIQFNVVSADTLKDAQLHPENYRSLIVRVAGFSAYFIHLDTMVQNEIIRRTEQSFEC